MHPQLLIPDWVAQSMQQDVALDAEMGRRQWLDAAVKELDPRLSIVWVKERCDPDVAAYFGLTPGRWHVRRDNPDGVEPSFKAITGPDGEFRGCDSGVLEELRDQDMWRGDVARRLFDAHRRKEERREHDQQLVAEARREDIATNVKALLAPGTLVNTDVPWSSRPAGRRARTRRRAR